MIKDLEEGFVAPEITSDGSRLGLSGWLGIVTPGDVWGRVAERKDWNFWVLV